MKKLSVCIVVPSDSEKLERCLKSVQLPADEIILVDMGMDSALRKRCEADFGANLFIDPGSGDAVEALNYGINQATGDWILWLHAHEYLDEQAGARLRDLLYEDSCSLILFHILSYIKSMDGRLQAIDYAEPRLILRDGDQQFSGFGESNDLFIYTDSIVDGTAAIGITPLKILSSPRIEQLIEEKKAAALLLEQLEGKLALDNGGSPWMYYLLGCRYYRLQAYDQMVRVINKTIELFLSVKVLPSSLIYKLKYGVVLNQKCPQKTYRGLQVALKMFPEYTDLHFYMGLAEFRKKRFEEALQAFEECLRLGETSGTYLIRQGTGSYQAHYYKGLCLEKLAQPEAAALAYISAIMESALYTPAMDAFEKMLRSGKRPLSHYLQDLDPEDAASLQLIVDNHRSKEKKKASDSA